MYEREVDWRVAAAACLWVVTLFLVITGVLVPAMVAVTMLAVAVSLGMTLWAVVVYEVDRRATHGEEEMVERVARRLAKVLNEELEGGVTRIK
jgi:hypothetical protein